MDDRRLHSIKDLLEALDRRMRRYRRWQVAVTCLSAVVVFVTVYMLVLPAVTLESSVDVPGIERTAGDESGGDGAEGSAVQTDEEDDRDVAEKDQADATSSTSATSTVSDADSATSEDAAPDSGAACGGKTGAVPLI